MSRRITVMVIGLVLSGVTVAFAGGGAQTTERAQSREAANEFRPDAWITLKAKLALMLSDEVESGDIDVDTTNNEITLHGAVASEQSKSAAERIARDIEGVTGVRNLLDVVPEEQREAHEEAIEAADEQLEERLEQMLDQWDDEGVDVEVQSVQNGVVVLDGDVDSLATHVSIVDQVRRVAGVRHVQSAIEPVTDDAFDEPDEWGTRDFEADASDNDADNDYDRNVFEDIWITTAVKSKLLANTSVPALDINVDTWMGEVTLFGTVESEAEKQEAEREARSVGSVKTIHNELQVVPESAEDATEHEDEVIEDKIEEILDSRDDLDEVDVEVADGVARLTGEVDSVSARLSAGTLVRSVAGVTSVVNDLRLDR